MIVETRKMECEFQLRELRELVETAEVLVKITEKDVRLKMITEEWRVLDDTVDLLPTICGVVHLSFFDVGRRQNGHRLPLLGGL